MNFGKCRRVVLIWWTLMDADRINRRALVFQSGPTHTKYD